MCLDISYTLRVIYVQYIRNVSGTSFLQSLPTFNLLGRAAWPFCKFSLCFTHSPKFKKYFCMNYSFSMCLHVCPSYVLCGTHWPCGRILIRPVTASAFLTASSTRDSLTAPTKASWVKHISSLHPSHTLTSAFCISHSFILLSSVCSDPLLN